MWRARLFDLVGDAFQARLVNAAYGFFGLGVVGALGLELAPPCHFGAFAARRHLDR
ncbi:hypothetical protein MPC1_2600005 [Methylocella tundrae]|nr:hypothetical protein MPC1_2600005 [Methylocella tundrae]